VDPAVDGAFGVDVEMWLAPGGRIFMNGGEQ
jgi:hypothetical protein